MKQRYPTSASAIVLLLWVKEGRRMKRVHRVKIFGAMPSLAHFSELLPVLGHMAHRFQL